MPRRSRPCCSRPKRSSPTSRRPRRPTHPLRTVGRGSSRLAEVTTQHGAAAPFAKGAFAYGGASLGNVGKYEQLDGMAFSELHPNGSLNEIITDNKLAPRNASGMVEYSMTISLLTPIHMSRGNHTLLYDVVNRGSKRSTDL